MKTIIKVWKKEFKDERFLIWFIGVLSFFILCALLIRWFLVFNDTRMGTIFEDPILKLFSPQDFTWPIFVLEYFLVISGLYFMLKTPHHFLRWGLAYSLLLLLRILTLWLVPLEPPPAMIFLQDPVIALFTSSSTPVKDLFFSGHTATVFLIYIGLEKNKFRSLYFSGALLIAAMIICQHAHYSIDVICAPLFAFLAYKMSTRFCTKFKFLKLS